MKVLPSTVTGLIEELDKLYPHRCIQPGQSETDAHRYAGRRELIDELKARLDATEKKALRDALLKQ